MARTLTRRPLAGSNLRSTFSLYFFFRDSRNGPPSYILTHYYKLLQDKYLLLTLLAVVRLYTIIAVVKILTI